MVTGPAFTRPLRWPIRWRLPLLICTLLLISLSAFGWAADREVRKALLELAQGRLQTISRQLLGLLTQSLQQRTVEARRIAAGPELQALAAAPDDAAALQHAQDELAAFLKTSPQTLGLEVWSASGKPLLNLPQPTPSAAMKGTPPARTSAPSAAGFSPLLAFHDVAYYELTVPLTSSTPSGYLVMRRQAMTPGAGGALGALIGNSVTVQFGSVTVVVK